jgi:phage tail sheath protein FI
MPSETTYPGVNVEELPSQIRTITGVSTSVTAFIDFFKKGPMNKAVHISSMGDFNREFGGIDPRSEASYAVQQFFLNGGSEAWVIRVSGAELDESKIDAKALIGDSTPTKMGLHALDDVDLFNILCIPRIAELSDSDAVKVITFACSYCEKRRAFFIVDPPKTCNDVQKIQDWLDGNPAVRHKNAGLYFPRIRIIDPLNDFKLRSIGASGTIAGLYARIELRAYGMLLQGWRQDWVGLQTFL